MSKFTVGRFQIDELTPAHHAILEKVAEVGGVVFIGSSDKKLTKKNPLPLNARTYLVKNSYPEVTIIGLPDFQSDIQWARMIDTHLKYLGDHWIGVSGYDGFHSTYAASEGRWPIELIENRDYHASAIRSEIGKHEPLLLQERRALIWAAENQYPQVMPTVDIALVTSTSVLLGKKANQTGWRLPGGFVDVNDQSFLHAAQRELFEETGLTASGYVCQGSFKINDWRLRGESNRSIISTLFTAHCSTGVAKAADDLADIRWVDFSNLSTTDIVTEHREMIERVKNVWLIGKI